MQNTNVHSSDEEEADLVIPRRGARRHVKSTQHTLDSEEDVKGVTTQVNTKHGSKAATDVQPKGLPKQAKKRGRPRKKPK